MISMGIYLTYKEIRTFSLLKEDWTGQPKITNPFFEKYVVNRNLSLEDCCKIAVRKFKDSVNYCM